MNKKNVLLMSIIILSIASLLFANSSLNFSLVELAQVSGGEKGAGQNFALSQGILGDVIGGSATIYSLMPVIPQGHGVTITASGTIDDKGAKLEIEVDEPEKQYPAIISEGTWEAQDVQLAEGERHIKLRGNDTSDNTQIQNLQVFVDTVPAFRPTLNSVITPTNSSPQKISGTKEPSTSIWVNGEEKVPLDSTTTWECDLYLQEGDNPFSIFSKDRAKNASSAVTGNIYLDTTAPSIIITSPLNGSLAIEPMIDVSGSTDKDVKSVEVNGISAVLSGNTFTAAGIPLIEGWNEIYAIARDGAGNSFAQKLKVFLDTTPPYKPTINKVLSPTNTSPQTISGIKDADTSLWLNNLEDPIIPMNPDTKWSYNMSLDEGLNPIAIYVMDGAGRTSPVDSENSILLDSSPPNQPIVSDDGAYLVASKKLHAAWLSGDAETGIAEYRYGIGTSPGKIDVVSWTSVSLDQQEVFIDNLGLIHRQIYYFTVQAKDFAGSWSEEGYSDGITVNKSIPEILGISPFIGAKFKEGEIIHISVSAIDADGDALEYRYFIDGLLVQDWIDSNFYDWNTRLGDYGRRSIMVEVSDALIGQAQSSEPVFIYIEPVRP